MSRRIDKLRREQIADPRKESQKRLEYIEVREGIRSPLYYNFYMDEQSEHYPGEYPVYLEVYKSCPDWEMPSIREELPKRRRPAYRRYSREELAERMQEFGLSAAGSREQLVEHLSQQVEAGEQGEDNEVDYSGHESPDGLLYSFYLGSLIESKKYDRKTSKALKNTFVIPDWDLYYSALEYVEGVAREMCMGANTAPYFCHELFIHTFYLGKRTESLPSMEFPEELIVLMQEDFADIPDGASFSQDEYGDRFLNTLYEENSIASTEVEKIQVNSNADFYKIISYAKRKFDEWYLKSGGYNSSFFSEDYNPYTTLLCPIDL